MAAYLLDGAAAPLELRQAFDYRAWGADLTRMPAGAVNRLNTAYNTHANISGWQRGGTDWVNANPKGWEFVSGIIAERARRRKEGTWPING